MRELTGNLRRKTHVLNKGNYLTPGEEVQPGLPAGFSEGFKADTLDRLVAAVSG